MISGEKFAVLEYSISVALLLVWVYNFFRRDVHGSQRAFAEWDFGG